MQVSMLLIMELQLLVTLMKYRAHCLVVMMLELMKQLFMNQRLISLHVPEYYRARLAWNPK